MLFYKTIDAPTLELLKKLLRIAAFNNLRLVGGTSLALQLGHRKSIDLDLFGSVQIDDLSLSEELARFQKVIILKKTPKINIFSIDGIKVDFVNYHYPWINEIIVEDGLRLADVKDIAAMKLAAITGRGSKKDFIDIYFLLKKFSLKEMMEMYNKKYPDGSDFLVLKSLTFFDDAEEQQEPVMFSKISWQEIKEKLLKEHSIYLRSLN
ncbi:MAG: nucleotidyl transferase AbiEii/AbiGii toxin family protein [Chitinophagaceae bacterium]